MTPPERPHGQRAANPSVRQVAERAGVSLGTVSNVLNRPHLVSEAARAKVQVAIAELGFVRNESARALRSGRSSTIAYVVLDASNPFFTDIARGVEDAVGADVTLFLCNSAEDAGREARYLEMLEQQRVLGVLITPLDPSSERLRGLPRRGTPVVLVDRASADESQCSVAVDDVLGGELAASHLLEMGHTRLGFVGGPMSIRQVSDRLVGARNAVRAAGGKGRRRAGDRDRGSQHQSGAGGRRPPGRRADASTPDGGVLRERSPSARAAAAGTSASTSRCPPSWRSSATTTSSSPEQPESRSRSIRQPRDLLGRTAAALLLDEASGNPEHVHQHVEFAPELVVRASTVRSHPR